MELAAAAPETLATQYNEGANYSSSKRDSTAHVLPLQGPPFTAVFSADSAILRNIRKLSSNNMEILKANSAVPRRPR